MTAKFTNQTNVRIPNNKILKLKRSNKSVELVNSVTKCQWDKNIHFDIHVFLHIGAYLLSSHRIYFGYGNII